MLRFVAVEQGVTTLSTDDRTGSISGRVAAVRARTFPVAARVYTDLVRRRTQVRVIHAGTQAGRTELAFVAGCFRSGTTLLRYVLDSHSELASPGESEFLLPLSELVDNERYEDALGFMGYPRPEVVSWVRRSASELFDNYGQAKGARIVIDKTPAYVQIAPLLAELFPQAKFLILHRHPLDQIDSFTRHLSYAPPEIPGLGDSSDPRRLASYAAQYWAESVDRLEQLRTAAGNRAIEVIYENFCADPATETARICEHLGVTYEPEMLEYWKFDHDLGLEGGKSLGFRTIEPRSGAWDQWPPEAVSAVVERTEQARELIGYGPDPTTIPRRGSSTGAGS